MIVIALRGMIQPFHAMRLLVKRHRVIRAESSVITKTGKTITSTRNDMIPTRTCEAEGE